MREHNESGQALVGTLVIMVLVFGMAGSVALAASSLLDRQSSHRSAVADDLRASDALTAAVANVAGHGRQTQPICQTIETRNTVLPGGFTSSATCLRFDGVANPDISTISLTWVSGCASVRLPASVQSQTWLFFSALAGAGLTAWVDAVPGCNAATGAPRECVTRISPAAVAVAAMDCDVAEVRGAALLHVLNSLASPAAIQFVRNASPSAQGNGGGGTDGDQHGGGNGGGAQVDSTGSIYVIAATTGLSGEPQFEAGAVFVSRDGTSTALLSEVGL